MAELTAQRTLVKSPPELWAELSEVESLAKHLGELGEIRITKTKPETTVAWEGEQISGTVELKQSGWGTRVTFHATVLEPEPGPEPEPDAEAEACPEPEAAAEQVPAAEPEAVSAPEPEPAREPEAQAVEPEEPALGPEASVADAEPETPAKPKRRGFIARWLFRERRPASASTIEDELDAVAEPEVTPEAEPEVVPEPEPDAVLEAEPEVAPEAEPEVVEAARREDEPEAEPAVAAIAADRVQQVLDSVLENLGQAHHRPFSRG